MKTCSICKNLLPFDLFSKLKRSKDGARSACKKCTNKITKTKGPKKDNRDKNRHRAYNKNYYKTHKSAKQEYDKQYYQLNKSDITARKRAYVKNRKKEDPCFKLRHLISVSVSRALKTNNSSKNGQSILKYLPYTIQELQKHIEQQFEPWMNWNNHGVYISDSWNDNVPSTWKWQLDHITPHSMFKYTSIEDQVLKECWALENLRPLSAKQNNLDGVNKTRHINT
jgi:hypothetical protein